MGMNLTETGNLVLVDRKGTNIWASFDNPTDSWVLRQTLTEGQRLMANVATSNWTEGQLYLSVVKGGLKAFVGSSPPQLYYKKGLFDTIAPNRTTYIIFVNGSLEIFTLFSQADMTIALPKSLSSAQYMKLEFDGHLRLYQLGTNGWVSNDVLDVFPSDCAYPTVCGEYGICSSGKCSCPEETPMRFPSIFERLMTSKLILVAAL